MSVIVGDCVVAMAAMAEGSVDAIVCDPPYGLGFMGKEWDAPGKSFVERRAERSNRFDHVGGNHNPANGADAARTAQSENRKAQAWHEAWAREALRVLKPGGHLLAFGGSRTYHRLMAGIEDAGFELRDCVMWLYGSGFPKSLDVSKAIDKAAGAEREVIGHSANYRDPATNAEHHERWNGAVLSADVTAPSTPEAERWEGWGTALKPGYEPIVLARKPLVGTVAGNVLAYGTGALNIDGCRIATDESLNGGAYAESSVGQGEGVWRGVRKADTQAMQNAGLAGQYEQPSGRWPANVVLSHSEGCVLLGGREVRSNGHSPASRGASGYGSAVDDSNGGGLKGQDGLVERRFDGERVDEWACVPGCPVRMLDDQAGERRTGKLTAEHQERGGFAGTVNAYGTAAHGGRNEYEASAGGASRFFYCAKAGSAERSAGCDTARNPHPTVKPIDLMRWLVRLVTPPGGVVLDPFLGSGTTGCAAALEGFEFVGIERDEDYARVAEARIAFWQAHPTGMPAEAALEGWTRRRKVADAGQLGLLDV